MELPGSSYLLALSAVTITFVGFSTIAVVFRQVQGAGLSQYEIVLLRMYVVSGLIATIFGLVPPLLALFDIPPAWIWRISSLTFAIVMIWRGIYFWQRQTHFERRKLFTLLYVLYAAVILGLIANVFGLFFEPGAGLYALAVTWMLVNAIISFILALHLWLRPPENVKIKEPVSPAILQEHAPDKKVDTAA